MSSLHAIMSRLNQTTVSRIVLIYYSNQNYVEFYLCVYVHTVQHFKELHHNLSIPLFLYQYFRHTHVDSVVDFIDFRHLPTKGNWSGNDISVRVSVASFFCLPTTFRLHVYLFHNYFFQHSFHLFEPVNRALLSPQIGPHFDYVYLTFMLLFA